MLSMEHVKGLVMIANLRFRLLFTKPNTRSGIAYIVLGPENTGTRVFTRFLIGMGCAGDKGHGQRFDYISPEEDEHLVVWRRSIPHNRVWTGFKGMIDLMKKLGYDVHLIRMDRSLKYNIQSQLRHKFAKSEKNAETRIHKANKILNRISLRDDITTHTVVYEQFTTDKKYRQIIAEELELKYNEVEKYENKNEQYK